MNIYFIGSIHGRKVYQAHYQKIIELVETAGHKIKADHVMETDSAELQSYDEEALIKRYKKNMGSLKKADAVFAELSYGSTSAGYMVALAVAMGKPVVIFYSGQEEPHLFRTLEMVNDKLVVVRYKSVENLDHEVALMLDFINDAQDTRFNFFVSPSISAYLDWVAKNRRIPRSVYLRKLIDEDMEQNDEFQIG
jgi:nucleoside 2-deoxyribosyltransferase